MKDIKLRAAILIVSETASKDPSTDKSTDLLSEVFEREADQPWQVLANAIVPDDINLIQTAIRRWTDVEDAVNLVVTSGGTGFAVKDVTPEVDYRLRSHGMVC
jgi:gephyrin